MATRRAYLFIEQWLRHAGLSDEAAGVRIGVERETIYRWRTEQHRLNPEKILAIADVCGCNPGDLWRLPNGRRSLDAMVDQLPEQVREMAVEMACDILRRLGASPKYGG